MSDGEGIDRDRGRREPAGRRGRRTVAGSARVRSSSALRTYKEGSEQVNMRNSISQCVTPSGVGRGGGPAPGKARHASGMPWPAGSDRSRIDRPSCGTRWPSPVATVGMRKAGARRSAASRDSMTPAMASAGTLKPGAHRSAASRDSMTPAMASAGTLKPGARRSAASRDSMTRVPTQLLVAAPDPIRRSVGLGRSPAVPCRSRPIRRPGSAETDGGRRRRRSPRQRSGPWGTRSRGARRMERLRTRASRTDAGIGVVSVRRAAGGVPGRCVRVRRPGSTGASRRILATRTIRADRRADRQ
jgi:hypothetical protein